jgi:hypothetical protein
VAVGLGLLIFLSTQGDMSDLGIAAIPILVGLGLLYDYRLTARDLRARQASRVSNGTTRRE